MPTTTRKNGRRLKRRWNLAPTPSWTFPTTARRWNSAPSSSEESSDDRHCANVRRHRLSRKKSSKTSRSTISLKLSNTTRNRARFHDDPRWHQPPRRLRLQGKRPIMNIVSRGGSLLFAWMEMTGNENPFYEHLRPPARSDVQSTTSPSALATRCAQAPPTCSTLRRSLS